MAERQRSTARRSATTRTRRGRLSAWMKAHPRLVRGVLLGTTFGITFAVGLMYAAWALVCRGSACPSVASLEEYTPHQTSKLYAADGRFITEIGLERRTLVRLNEIPRIVQDAFIETEDHRFYQHSGVDWYRVAGAAFYDIRARGWEQGFSTITMQLARNVFPETITREKTPLRKLREAKVARAIEQRFSKQRILELYLNQINLGSGAYGVETASQRYFGKSVRDLNIAEAATLAALPKAPGRYNPRRYPDRAMSRRNTIIELMRRAGRISDADASLARAYPLQLARKQESGEIAAYFVEWVRQQLDEKFGRQLYEEGLKVYTTLDLDMQSAAERALEQQLRAIESGKYGKFSHTTFEQYMARQASDEASTIANSPYLQGAFVAVDPRNGAVRALVGGRSFDDSKFNRAIQALRQPGSTFKPIVYSTAIQNGRPASYPLDDSPLSVPQVNGTTWNPQNYDGKFEGRIPMRRALYLSRNLAAIRLGMELGEGSVIDMARKFGISTPIPPYPAIHIGAADVYPIELISAYTAFSTLGIRSAPLAIVRVDNADGETLWEPTPQRSTVMSPEESWLMVSMMKDVVRRGTAAGSVGAEFPYPAGGKTGTTNDGADVWFIGYTTDLVAGVWMGMDRPQKIKASAQGGILAAPAWTSFMNEVYRRRPSPPDWPRPDAIITREVDGTSGLLKSPFCPANVVYTEYYIPGTEPIRECDVHVPGGPGDTLGTMPVTTPGATTLPPITPGRPPRTRPRPDSTRDTTNPFAIPPPR